MSRGVILSIKKRFVTLLTPEGEFVKVKKQDRHYEIGEEVVFFTPVRVKDGSSILRFRLSGKKSVVLSLAISIVILLAILPTFFTGHVSAYMTIDVNPSIELELNDRLEVLSLTGLNKDGSLVIGKLSSWEGKDVKSVTNRILKVTKEMGYFKEKKQIVVSTTLLDDDADLKRSLKEEMNEITQEKKVQKADMKLMQASEKDREQAKEEGISTGRYLEKMQKEKNQKNEKETNKQSSQINSQDKKKDNPDESSKKKDNGIINENRSTNSEKETVNSQSQARKTKEVLHRKTSNLGTSQTSSSANKPAPDRKASKTIPRERTGNKMAVPKRKTELKPTNKKVNKSQERRDKDPHNQNHPTVNKKNGPRQPVDEIKQKRKPSNMKPPGQIKQKRTVPGENHTEARKHGRDGQEVRVGDHHNK